MSSFTPGFPSFQVSASFWKKLQNSFGNNFKIASSDSIYFMYTNRQNQSRLSEVRAVVTLGGGAVTKREREGSWDGSEYWSEYWLPRCVYFVKMHWTALIRYTHFSVHILFYSGSVESLLRLKIALFLSYVGCNLNTSVWKSVCAFLPPPFLLSPFFPAPTPPLQ